jgi:hypothetical protein
VSIGATIKQCRLQSDRLLDRYAISATAEMSRKIVRLQRAKSCRNAPVAFNGVGFCSANTCSTRERISDLALSGRRIVWA